MRLLIITKPHATIIYFTIYCILISPLFIIFNKLNIKTTKNIRSISSLNPLFLIIISILLISLGGLPPLTGFFPKLITLFILAESNIIIFLVLIIGSLINLYFYLNIVINSIIMTPETSSIKPLRMFNNRTSALIVIALTILGITPFIIIIYAMTLLYKS